MSRIARIEHTGLTPSAGNNNKKGPTVGPWSLIESARAVVLRQQHSRSATPRGARIQRIIVVAVQSKRDHDSNIAKPTETYKERHDREDPPNRRYSEKHRNIEG